MLHGPIDSTVQVWKSNAFQWIPKCVNTDAIISLAAQITQYIGGYIAPPTYNTAVDGTDGSVSVMSPESEGAGQGEGQQDYSSTDKTGGYWLRQRH